MQLMPATFASLGVGSNVRNPRQNLEAGTKVASVAPVTSTDVVDEDDPDVDHIDETRPDATEAAAADT